MQVVGLESSDAAVAQRLHTKSHPVKPKPRRNRFTALTRAPGKSSVHMGASCCHISRQNVPWIAWQIDIAWSTWHCHFGWCFFIQSSSVRTLLCQGDVEIWRWDSRKWTQPRLTESSDVTTVGCHVWTRSSWSRARAGVDHHCGKHWWRRASALAWTAFSLRRLRLAPCLQAQTAAPPSTDPFALLAWPRWQREKSWKDVSRHDRLAREFWCWKQSSQLAEGVGTWPDS